MHARLFSCFLHADTGDEGQAKALTEFLAAGHKREFLHNDVSRLTRKLRARDVVSDRAHLEGVVRLRAS